MIKRLAVVALVLVGACGGDDGGDEPAPGEILGHVEVSPEIPASGCVILLEGTPSGAKCDDAGAFDLRAVPAGRWTLRILPDAAATTLPSRRVAAAANSGFISDLGALELAHAGAVGGHVTPLDLGVLSTAYVAIPDIGAVTVPNPDGGYLLQGVSPGVHDVALITPAGSVVDQTIEVAPAKTTIGIDFDLGAVVASMTNVTGVAARTDGSAGGLTVELVSALDGTIADHATTPATGAFSLTGAAGAYLVRAHDGGSPIAATIPSVVLTGVRDVALSSTLVVPRAHGDLDGDGIPDDEDGDIDGDGVPNDADAFPYDPAETTDTDGDGIGDRADLATGGTSVDHHDPTPDTDGDGRDDFEDDCPTVPDPQQADADRDGIGDACDTCPLIPNADQTGFCVQCLSADQCGDLACLNNTCAACTATAQCAQGRTCDVATGRCVACGTESDCGDGKTCVGGECVLRCTDDTACPGAHCDDDVCVECRATPDCPHGQYCDDHHACQAQCTVAGGCTDGQICDVPTGTCVTPCNGDCTAGERCIASVCHPACDGSTPCPAGQDCNAATGACGPQCAVTNDCAADHPHTTCNAGACVPDGTCNYDADCAGTELCTAGTCTARPTTFDPGEGFRCTQACDCRTGEVCDAEGGHCVADVAALPDGTSTPILPTIFAQANPASGGTGLVPNKPTDIATGLAMFANGNGTVLALRAGDSATTAPVVLAAGDAIVAGGYQVCAANRWVRDAAKTTSLVGSATTVISVPGSDAMTFPRVGVVGLALSSSDGNLTHRRVFVDAAHAPGLYVDRVAAAQALGNAGADEVYGGVVCDHCANVAISHLTIAGGTGNGHVVMRGVSLTAASGTIADVTYGGVHAGGNRAIEVNGTVGALSIKRVTVPAQASGETFGILVTACGTNPVTGAPYPLTIADSALGWNDGPASGATDNPSYALEVVGCGATAISGVIVDGGGQSMSPGTQRGAVWLVDSGGTVDNTHVVLPTIANGGGQVNFGIGVTGPHGGFAITQSSVAGGARPVSDASHVAVDIDGVTTGTVAISGGSYAIAGARYGFALVGTNAGSGTAPTIVVSDAVLETDGVAGAGAPDAISLASSSARLVRAQVVGRSAASEVGISITGGALDVEDSYVFADASSGGAVEAIVVRGGAAVRVVGSTIDAGASTATANTIGIDCDDSARMTARSSLIGGGGGVAHRSLYASGTAACYAPAAFTHDYFWFARPSGQRLSDDEATAVQTGTGNTLGDAVGCYDATLADPTFHIGATSPCVDGGEVTTLFDGSPNATDITGGPRALGGAPDIGAYEKQ